MKQVVFGFFLCLFLLLCVVILGLGYFGFIPVLSTMLGSDKPRDLGVKYSEVEYTTYTAKDKSDIVPIETNVKPEESIAYSGQTELVETFSQEEVSARINYAQWKYMPISNVQIRFPTNDTIEVSGTLRMDRLDGFIRAVGGTAYNKQDVEKGLKYLGVLPGNPPIHARAAVKVKDNDVRVSLTNVEVGRFPVPLGSVDLNSAVEGVAEHIIRRIPGLSITSVVFSEGTMRFVGTTPTKTMVAVQ